MLVKKVTESSSFLHNRFSVLETQSDSDLSECNEDDANTNTYKVTPPKPRKKSLVGGRGQDTGNVSNASGEKSDSLARKYDISGNHKRKSEERASSSDYQIPCSDNVDTDKVDNISELTETVLSETSLILESSKSIPVEQDLHELESNTRDVSVDTESVVHVCKIVTVETNVETGTNEIISEVNTSIDEVIGLLNNKNTEYTGEKQQSEFDTISNIHEESVNLFQGQKFDTYEDFKSKYEIWCVQNSHPMRTDSSQKNDEDSPSQFPFRQIRFTCKHSGKQQSRGNGKRPVQAYLACERPVSLKLVLDNKCKQYKISKLSEVHNHTTSKREFKHYVTSRKLETNVKEEIKTLIDLNVETKNIKTFIKEKTGKSIGSGPQTLHFKLCNFV